MARLTGSIERSSSRGHALCLLLVLAAVSLGPGCNPLGGISTQIDTATADATRVLDDGITTISQNSDSWQNTLQGMQSKLTVDTQQTLRNEINDLMKGSIAVANSGVQCDFDFIAHRVLQELKSLRADLLKQPTPDTSEPAACVPVPAAIDFAHWQRNGVPTAQVFGYDLDNSALALWLVDSNGQKSDMTSHLLKSSAYQRTVDLRRHRRRAHARDSEADPRMEGRLRQADLGNRSHPPRHAAVR